MYGIYSSKLTNNYIIIIIVYVGKLEIYLVQSYYNNIIIIMLGRHLYICISLIAKLVYSNIVTIKQV